ncbi:hypothetical protein F5Y16DRAFT_371212 [Xylariaceae sp. FL0255]|nr:hypothetical protein F5Y16DRAFT_371212 [Xylariaceae sp. FL0255]
MSSLNGGGDPVTALGVRGISAVASVAHRRAKVGKSIRDSLARYDQAGTNGRNGANGANGTNGSNAASA